MRRATVARRKTWQGVRRDGISWQGKKAFWSVGGLQKSLRKYSKIQCPECRREGGIVLFYERKEGGLGRCTLCGKGIIQDFRSGVTRTIKDENIRKWEEKWKKKFEKGK